MIPCNVIGYPNCRCQSAFVSPRQQPPLGGRRTIAYADDHMDTTPTQNTPPSARPADGKRRIFLILGTIAVVVVIAVIWIWMLTASREPVAPSTRPIDLPVSEQDVTSMEQIAALTDGKPVPPVFEGVSLPPFDENDHVYGEQAAPYSIVEYANFGNKYASLLHPELKAFVDSDKSVNWIFRHYSTNVNDYMPAQAAECAYFDAGRQADFWSFFDATFPSPVYSIDVLTAIATGLGLDSDAFRTCMEQHHTRDRVLGDSQDARLDGKVVISPSYLVSNNVTGEVRLVEGVNTIDYLKQVVDAVR